MKESVQLIPRKLDAIRGSGGLRDDKPGPMFIE